MKLPQSTKQSNIPIDIDSINDDDDGTPVTQVTVSDPKVKSALQRIANLKMNKAK